MTELEKLSQGPKFKAGWYVRVKDDLIVNKAYNELPFIEQMEKYKGKTFRIRRCFYSMLNRRYFLEEKDDILVIN